MRSERREERSEATRRWAYSGDETDCEETDTVLTSRTSPSLSPRANARSPVVGSMETILVFAALTGRTLVIPPPQGMYLLNKAKGEKNKLR